MGIMACTPLDTTTGRILRSFSAAASALGLQGAGGDASELRPLLCR